MKRIVIIYSDKKNRDNQRVVTINVPQIKNNKLSLSEMDFCDRVAEDFRCDTEDIMSWRIEDVTNN